jgi:hypothetical protein
MNLSTIEMPKDEARERLAEYEAALKAERTAQDEAIAMGYRALARGLPLIKLSESIARGGYFGNGLPRIAVIRATETECYVRWRGNDLVFNDGVSDNRGALVGRWTVRVPIAEPPDVPNLRRHGGNTIVPLIPPRCRPAPRRLKHCHILWEVESWTPVPPTDPALIRHIRGDLWAVLATWDLTELERAVLAM